MGRNYGGEVKVLGLEFSDILAVKVNERKLIILNTESRNHLRILCYASACTDSRVRSLFARNCAGSVKRDRQFY